MFDEFAVGRACDVFDLRRGSFRVWASRRQIASRLSLALVCDVGSVDWLVSNRSGCFGFQGVNHFITSALARRLETTGKKVKGPSPAPG